MSSKTISLVPVAAIRNFRIAPFNEQNILTHAGSISHDAALAHAHQEFEKYDAEQKRLEVERPTSDFDKVVDQVKQLKPKERKPARQISSKDKKRPDKRKKRNGRRGNGR
jgi:hypothetical protein